MNPARLRTLRQAAEELPALAGISRDPCRWLAARKRAGELDGAVIRWCGYDWIDMDALGDLLEAKRAGRRASPRLRIVGGLDRD